MLYFLLILLVAKILLSCIFLLASLHNHVRVFLWLRMAHYDIRPASYLLMLLVPSDAYLSHFHIMLLFHDCLQSISIRIALK